MDTGESKRRVNVPIAVMGTADAAFAKTVEMIMTSRNFKLWPEGLLPFLHSFDHRADNTFQIVFAADLVILHVDERHVIKFDDSCPSIARIPFGER